jgi:hypothetical protein
MRARMAAYSAWNSAPSRLSHSSSDGVNGRGAEEIAGFGLGEDVDAEADVVPPVFVEEFAMLLRERVKRLGAQRKYLTSTARAQRGRQDDRAAVALDMAPKVREGATEADMIVHEDVVASGLDLPVMAVSIVSNRSVQALSRALRSSSVMSGSTSFRATASRSMR